MSLPLASLNSVSAACLRPRGEDEPLPALVTIFLRGGADAMNIVVPYGTKRYYDIRPTLAIPPPKSEGGALKLDKKFGNKGFLAKAPEHVVEEQHERKRDAESTETRLAAALARL